MYAIIPEGEFEKSMRSPREFLTNEIYNTLYKLNYLQNDLY